MKALLKKRKTIIIALILIIGIVITISFLFKKKEFPNITHGVPQESSPALLDYFLNEFGGFSIVEEDDDSYILRGQIEDYNQTKTAYYRLSKEELDHLYELFFIADSKSLDTYNISNPRSGFNTQLRNKLENYDNEIDGLQRHYPYVTMKDNKELTIETTEGKKTFNLSKLLSDYDYNKDEYLSFHLLQATEEMALIRIRTLDSDDDFEALLLVDQDFSTVEVIDSREEELESFILSKDFSPYKELFMEREISDDLFHLIDIYNRPVNFYDDKEQEILTIDDDDVISEDREYVYLDGDTDRIESGKQYIQKTEDYFAGNDTYETFEIDLEDIYEALEEEELDGKVTDAYVRNFERDFISLLVSYEVEVDDEEENKTERTQVFIDRQDNKEHPHFYLYMEY